MVPFVQLSPPGPGRPGQQPPLLFRSRGTKAALPWCAGGTTWATPRGPSPWVTQKAPLVPWPRQEAHLDLGGVLQSHPGKLEPGVEIHRPVLAQEDEEVEQHHGAKEKAANTQHVRNLRALAAHEGLPSAPPSPLTERQSSACRARAAASMVGGSHSAPPNRRETQPWPHKHTLSSCLSISHTLTHSLTHTT
jgi:hypothetical protein